MTGHTDITPSPEILKPVFDRRTRRLPEAVSPLVNHAMLIEREHHLFAEAATVRPRSRQGWKTCLG